MSQTEIITVFRSRLDPHHETEYYARAEEIAELARAMPGHLSHKSFTAEDGERVTIVEFDSLEHHRAWANHPEHRIAMAQGADQFYSEYAITVAEVTRRSDFNASPTPSGAAGAIDSTST